MLALEQKENIIRQLLTIYDEDEAKAIANELISFCAKQPDFNIATAISRLLKNEPLQYVLGEAWFYHLPFKVNPNVLIPRPETEELVHLIIEDFIHHTSHIIHPSILDIGTGSGCIPIVLKKNIPEAKVYGMDISAEALTISKQNAALNNVAVDFFQGNILTSNFQLPTSNFHIIVSNPPYITEIEKVEMHANVLAHEPHLALFISDQNPLQFYEAISSFAAQHLVKGGKLFFEINASYGKGVKLCMEKYGFTEVSIKKDMQGKDRMVFGVLN